jgi:hypothetical protein
MAEASGLVAEILPRKTEGYEDTGKIVRYRRQRGKAVCQRSENGAWHERQVLHVTRRYVTANWRERSFCGLQPVL